MIMNLAKGTGAFGAHRRPVTALDAQSPQPGSTSSALERDGWRVMSHKHLQSVTRKWTA